MTGGIARSIHKISQKYDRCDEQEVSTKTLTYKFFQLLIFPKRCNLCEITLGLFCELDINKYVANQ